MTIKDLLKELEEKAKQCLDAELHSAIIQIRTEEKVFNNSKNDCLVVINGNSKKGLYGSMVGLMDVFENTMKEFEYNEDDPTDPEDSTSPLMS